LNVLYFYISTFPSICSRSSSSSCYCCCCCCWLNHTSQHLSAGKPSYIPDWEWVLLKEKPATPTYRI